MPGWFLKDVHRRSREAFSEHLDGRLESEQRTQLEAHLERCPRCRGELAALQDTVEQLRALPSAPAPRSFRITTDQVRQPAAGPLWYGLLPGLRLASAGVAVLFLAVVTVEALVGSQAASVFTEITAAVPSAKDVPAALAPATEPGAARTPTRDARFSNVPGAAQSTPEAREHAGQGVAPPPPKPGPASDTRPTSPAAPTAEVSAFKVFELLLLGTAVLLIGATAALTFLRKRNSS